MAKCCRLIKDNNVKVNVCVERSPVAWLTGKNGVSTQGTHSQGRSTVDYSVGCL